VATGIAALVACLVAFAPARLLLAFVDAAAPLQPVDVGGTLWHGHCTLRLRGPGIDIAHVRWQVLPTRLARLQAAARIETDGGITAAGTVAGAPGRGASIEVDTLRLSAGLLNRAGAAYYIEVAADIIARDLRLVHDGTTITRASGHAEWPGGPVRYVLNGRAIRTHMPPLAASIDGNASGLYARVTRADSGMPMLSLGLDGQGWATVAVTRGFIEAAGQAWPGSERADDVVIEVQEQIGVRI
jgi:hypothetical protein